MIIVVSPAKTLDYESPLPAIAPSQPAFIDEAATLNDNLRQLTVDEIGELMSISPKLASLNSERYHNWQPTFTDDNSRPAVFAFKGDVYQGLDVASMDAEDLQFAQDHLRVLSGMYGLLRPLDRMQPYRLEMGTKLAVNGDRNLYEFWDRKIVAALNDDLAAVASDVLVNLASNEYFRSVKLDELTGKVVSPVFKDWKNGAYKIISFYAKKARGAMARYLIQNRIEDPAGMLNFTWEGYRYNPELSTDDAPAFTRKVTA